jgi:hypothetical protein
MAILLKRALKKLESAASGRTDVRASARRVEANRAVPTPLVVGDDERLAGLAGLGGVEDQEQTAAYLAAAFDGPRVEGD